MLDPMLRTAPQSPGALWSAKLLASELVVQGIGALVVPLQDVVRESKSLHSPLGECS